MPEKPVVLLTNAMHRDGEALLTPHVRLIVASDTRPETLRQCAADADGIIVRAKLPDDIVDHAPRLKGIVRHGVGLDFIPVAAATARGVAVANLPGSNTNAVAEYVMSALMHLRRPLQRVDALMRAEGWATSRAMADGLTELSGTTLGILGVGTIGRRIANIASNGFGMKVLGTSRRKGSLPPDVEEVTLVELFARSNAVVVCCALTDETRRLVSHDLLAHMRPQSVLVNVSRGAVVDTPAIIYALRSGKLAGAALDVFDVQPLPPDDALFDCPNLLLTPHTAGITASSGRAMAVGSAEEMLRILRGEQPLNLVNPEHKTV
ncbi:NAD(P)-dependent oxidoreductase [Bradyrhizobium sp. Arg237L]|uniref:NAD(P)-dependent oxidoreductase n=1 Tax=Bradyrhizobium sp. Arg237L TaxID=3003352 RepID=UPI00249E4DCE|nr:NAD(P)-dependent oxidoreductase [Bradyrhizobium sp. Arg237L]MDI4233985.1 NAD(P)-dependent oxidoreductase [Bradyrhizobium sp. Arg237L]